MNDLLNKILERNVMEMPWPIPDNSVDCCVTSPPYWGLRDYGNLDQIGLEATPDLYLEKMVKVFEEVRRVLKPQGTLWLNLGDSYAGNGGQYGSVKSTLQGRQSGEVEFGAAKRFIKKGGLKPKDLVGIPWMVAFALRSAGWYLRQDIIWSKPNPMPESVTNRCTKAHEYIFLLSKSSKYFYDNEAIKTESNRAGEKSYHDLTNPKYDAIVHERWKDQFDGRNWGNAGRANKRSVWSVATTPFSEAHFATFPEALILPCILAGCPKDGIVLDPFMGAGTTALVAMSHGRKFIGMELNPEYIKIANKRLKYKFGMFYHP